MAPILDPIKDLIKKPIKWIGDTISDVGDWIKKDSIVICEHSPNLYIKKSTLWEIIDVRDYGQSRLTFLINVKHP